ncbi:MAG: recombinase family protein, partial [Candidatus Staskawiczbacteria bacterium]|nr:recombinase family protein [Candidatus Staskawiczbacteria bacterium]
MKAILFCRVSSREQEVEGYSLPAQEKFINDYASKKALEIDKIFSISESASGKTHRKLFDEMLDYVKKNNIKIVVCE